MPAATKSVSPKTASLSPVVFAFGTLGAAVMGAGAMIFFFNPSTHSFYPVCWFHAVTGLNCPGCGMTRALYALLHGELRLALKDNALLVLTPVVLAIWSGRSVFLRWQNRPVTFSLPPKFLWAGLGVIFAFAVIRNLPGFEWLSP